MYHTLTANEALEKLHTSQTSGLFTPDAQKRYETYGPNQLPETKKETTFHKIFRQFTDTLVLILIFAVVVSFIVGETLDAVVILIIIFINGAMGYIQEARAEKAIDALKDLSADYAKVVRDSKIVSLEISNIVPGDIVLLESGDKIPADARLVEAVRLEIDEAVLTGESHTVEKTTSKLEDKIPIADTTNMVYKDTTISYGRGKAVVTATGKNTEIGKISKLLESEGSSWDEWWG